MTYQYAITSGPLPLALNGADGDYSIRSLTDKERVAIEDYFFGKNIKVGISADTAAVIVPQGDIFGGTMEHFAVLVEFALAVLTVSGFQPVSMVAVLSDSNCVDALQRGNDGTVGLPVFPKRLVKAAASAWVRRLFAVQRKIKGKLHVTADRFVRYSRVTNSGDALVDLCICLESIIESQTEISFRFSTCLAKVSALRNAEEMSELLSDLYDLRSKVVHGSDFTKEHKKIAPKMAELRFAARAVLTTYILYLTEHTKDEWKHHLRRSLFA
jgi:hypothetical protein